MHLSVNASESLRIQVLVPKRGKCSRSTHPLAEACLLIRARERTRLMGVGIAGGNRSAKRVTEAAVRLESGRIRPPEESAEIDLAVVPVYRDGGCVLFEITKDQIAQLTDTDLRILIGLLCETELRRKNFSTLAVTYGGHQDAKDGGLDARVSLDPKAQIGGAIPRPLTGFQSKAEPMAPAEITKEMRPKDQLRPIFHELADAQGAYILASSKSSVTDIARTNRIRAMKDAVSELSNHGNLHLDFYDGNRLATWVRDHPGMVLWVREKIGRPLKNWRPYEQWTTATADDPFLTDEGLRLRSPKASSGSSVSIIEGFAEVRQALSTPRNVVRFVGLSGVGKTRIAQALFEDDVLGSPLDRSLALYTNLGPSTAT